MGSELEQGDMGDILQLPLEGWVRNLSKRRKKSEEGIQECGSEGETQADNGTERTETAVSGWTGEMLEPGRWEVSSSTTVGGSFGKSDAGMGHLRKWTWIKESETKPGELLYKRREEIMKQFI